MRICLPETPMSDGLVMLRRVTEADVGRLLEIYNSGPDLDRFTMIPQPYTEKDARDWIATHEANLEDGLSVDLGIADAHTGELAGAIGMPRIDWENRRAELGYMLAPEARGRGRATTAVRLLCGWAFAGLGLARIEIQAEPGNEASQRVAERAGFTREGLIRSSREFKGRRRDMWVFSLLATDVVPAQRPAGEANGV